MRCDEEPGRSSGDNTRTNEEQEWIGLIVRSARVEELHKIDEEGGNERDREREEDIPRLPRSTGRTEDGRKEGRKEGRAQNPTTPLSAPVGVTGTNLRQRGPRTDCSPVHSDTTPRDGRK